MIQIKKLQIIIWIAFIAIILQGCGSSGSKSTEESSTKSSALNLDIEKPQLKFGFIKLTDMAPFAIAKELGLF